MGMRSLKLSSFSLEISPNYMVVLLFRLSQRPSVIFSIGSS